MRKLEVWFENGVNDEELTKLCEDLIAVNAKFLVCSEPDGYPACCFYKNGVCNYREASPGVCVGMIKGRCPLGKS